MERARLEYWRQEFWADDAPLTRAYWDDPLPDVQGMLTSEYIVAYQHLVGGMILRFEDRLLKPAAYELTLGRRCMVEGSDHLLSEEDPWLEIPPNSIAFVSMEQVLRLPHYIVGRFDLAIDFIYEGLLLGTGPQVDPGFQGALSCPLHNISNDPIYIRLGQEFAKIDFVKTAPPLRPGKALQWRDEIDDVEELGNVIGHKPAPRHLEDVKLFKDGDPEWREPIYGYLRAKRPKSSVKPLRDDVRRLQRYGVVGIIGVFLTSLGFLALYVQARTERLASRDDVTELRERIDDRDRAAQAEIRRLRARIAALE